jgi:hypothetical protein
MISPPLIATPGLAKVANRVAEETKSTGKVVPTNRMFAEFLAKEVLNRRNKNGTLKKELYF